MPAEGAVTTNVYIPKFTDDIYMQAKSLFFLLEMCLKRNAAKVSGMLYHTQDYKMKIVLDRRRDIHVGLWTKHHRFI
jgi:hypothetical protein